MNYEKFFRARTLEANLQATSEMTKNAADVRNAIDSFLPMIGAIHAVFNNTWYRESPYADKKQLTTHQHSADHPPMFQFTIRTRSPDADHRDTVIALTIMPRRTTLRNNPSTLELDTDRVTTATVEAWARTIAQWLAPSVTFEDPDNDHN